ncbi:hypothetical protein HAX54_041630 [Datura stramonium]|uniref:Uncharacterized protein n=1 Tax=Datura stramonium TaxID=4076 RepID=A0ABS8VZ82_DATST|nr:hypothetical protein [Datura stramonium]
MLEAARNELQLEALVERYRGIADLEDLLTQIHGVNTELDKFRADMGEQIRTLEADYAEKCDAVKAEMEIVHKEKEDLRAGLSYSWMALQGTVFRSGSVQVTRSEPKAYNELYVARRSWKIFYGIWKIISKQPRYRTTRRCRSRPCYWVTMPGASERTMVAEGVVARGRLCGIRSKVSSVGMYVKEFSSLMLNVGNMTEEDKLHYFDLNENSQPSLRMEAGSGRRRKRPGCGTKVSREAREPSYVKKKFEAALRVEDYI